MQLLAHHKLTILLALALTPLSKAQDTACSRFPDQPRLRLCEALRRLKAGDSAQIRFTRFKLEHNENLLDGKPLHDTHKLFEDLWINNLPYERLVEVEGKPLQGADLAAEQARYDKAVADRKALDLKARAALTGGQVFSVHLDLDSALTEAYRLAGSAQESCHGTPCTHLTFEPTGLPLAGKPAPQRRMEFWLSDATPLLLSARYEVLKDEKGQQQGASGQMDWMLFDGVPVEQHSFFTGERKTGLFHKLTIRTDNVYDRYRRFTTSITLRPTEEDAAPQPPQ